MMSPNVAIVGAGMGGLSAAVSLSHRADWEVTVLEAASNPGGKLGVSEADGVEFDTGPSLLTLPSILTRLCGDVNRDIRQELTLFRPDPITAYHFADGTAIDVRKSRETTQREIEEALGAAAASDFAQFLSYARRIWEAAAPHFVFGPAPKAITAVKLGLTAMRDLMAIDAGSTMCDALESRIDEPRIRDLFMRYATFSGSDPRRAPATMHCVGWVDLGLGGWGVEGGMYELARALERIAGEGGVKLEYGCKVTSIRPTSGGLEVRWCGRRRVFDAVVVNNCARQLAERLWDGDGGLGIDTDREPSTSAWTAVMRARRRLDRRPHTIVFPRRDYLEEFVDLFDRAIPPREPTIYLCAREKAHRARGWPDEEPLFVMANVPAVGQGAEQVDWEDFEARIVGRLRSIGVVDADDEVVWRRTPEQLARRFPCSRGSLYGAACNSKLAAFRRPANRVSGIDGLYLAGGTVHPGGGIPLSIQSGRQAARQLLADVR